ncbi:MAG TPA: hypothetical protein PLX20_10145 [Rhodocyclaceae bacterium]|nr:hypothetical protein [Rhodocyclaceae bacterium]HMV53443.1 hypothetical protein [Rhodocyclaceae bacterium]HMZ83751.1 hypothetical protein [Rhodocyclaceae bacterium]HNA03876.1 hypothetical protein [Rhodocyclaceae bacterium]HNB79479.1 hypothetical protein [Rhodocyclaceae bacterium]
MQISTLLDVPQGKAAPRGGSDESSPPLERRGSQGPAEWRASSVAEAIPTRTDSFARHLKGEVGGGGENYSILRIVENFAHVRAIDFRMVDRQALLTGEVGTLCSKCSEQVRDAKAGEPVSIV